LCVFAFVSTDQCVSRTSVKAPTYTVETPSPSFDEVTSECVLGVVTALSASVVQASNTVTAVPIFFQQ
jgi:hypothetical protein